MTSDGLWITSIIRCDSTWACCPCFSLQRPSPSLSRQTFAPTTAPGRTRCKRALLREAHGWVDPPEYYGATAAGAMPAQGSACGIPTSVVSELVQARLCMQGAPQRYLVYGASLSERARRLGGFETILSQLKRFELAVRVASLTNRTLVLPRLR